MHQASGIHVLKALLQQDRFKIKKVEVIAQRRSEFEAYLQQAQSKGCSVNVVKAFKDPSARQYGITSYFDFKFMDRAFIDPRSHRKILMLDRLQDPHNFGACMRSAAAFGVDLVIVPQRASAPVNQVVHQISCGGSILVPIVSVQNLRQVMTELKDQGVWFVATDEHATSDFTALDHSVSLCLVMGSEGEGVKQSLKDSCDYQVAIQTASNFSTLNVSVATGILLSQWRNSTQ
ncbi:23S rRNA (guanosine(2251)-2'-O)-methyltransferase RlmB [Gammaproteobacteria bacterium]|nr:23S rRNA (guanosine(2251)-2'-O)-methyltransferase RlmB [Gammaproteobacteria bacterium]